MLFETLLNNGFIGIKLVLSQVLRGVPKLSSVEQEKVVFQSLVLLPCSAHPDVDGVVSVLEPISLEDLRTLAPLRMPFSVKDSVVSELLVRGHETMP